MVGAVPAFTETQNMMIHSDFSGHTLFVQKITNDELPKVIADNTVSKTFTTFYVVKNWDAQGVVFMYLAKGHSQAPAQVCVFYRSGQFWTSYGKTIKAAIEGAQRDGWMYA